MLSSNGVILSMDLSLLKLQVTLSRCSYDFDNNFFLGEPRDNFGIRRPSKGGKKKDAHFVRTGGMGKKARERREKAEKAKDCAQSCAQDFGAALETFRKSKTAAGQLTKSAADWLGQWLRLCQKADRACHAYNAANKHEAAVDVYEAALKELEELRALCQPQAREFALHEAMVLNNAGAQRTSTHASSLCKDSCI